MSSTPASRPVKSAVERYFYSFAVLLLLGLTVAGFHHFYFEGRAYPGRELTPPIRPLILVHGLAMTVWLVLAIVQPFLVAAHRVHVHRRLGVFTAGLALVLTYVGLRLAIESARIAPPDQMFGPLTARQFTAVTVFNILLFGGFVVAGVLLRRRPPIHRAMMFLATLAAVTAGIARIDLFNQLYYDTVWQRIFGDFFFTLVVGGALVAAKLVATRAPDRGLVAGYAAFTAVCILATQLAPTPFWDRVATILLR